MTPSQEYDEAKNKTADRFREMDAVDEVLSDIKGLRVDFYNTITEDDLEVLIEQVEEWINYEEDLNYILRNIPDEVKAQLV